jgi:type IV pilus assembly protein PilN
MSNINLLPWREQEQYRRKILFFVAVIVSSLVVLSLCYGVKIYIDSIIKAQYERNQYLQTEISILDNEIREIDLIKKEKIELAQRISLIQQLESKRNMATRLFNLLPEITPVGVYLTSLHFDQGRIDLKGLAETHEQVSQMVRNVEHSLWFGDVSLPSIIDSNKQIKRYQFSMRFIVLPEKESKP